MEIILGGEHADELRTILDSVFGDLSAEIADTDNAAFRRSLRERRTRIQAIRGQLG